MRVGMCVCVYWGLLAQLVENMLIILEQMIVIRREIVFWE